MVCKFIDKFFLQVRGYEIIQVEKSFEITRDQPPTLRNRFKALWMDIEEAGLSE